MKKPYGYWTKERCAEEALKYKTKKDFNTNSLGSYKASYRMNIMNDICSHMKELLKPKGYWSKEKCKNIAIKYNNITEFRNESETAYRKSVKYGWINEITSHMIKIKPSGYWTKEKCREEALKYDNRTKFQNESSSAYIIALKNNWLNDICCHIEVCGNYIKRCIYVYEFSDNSAYIGLTYNFNNRHKKHIADINSSVYKKIKQKVSFNFKQLTDYIDVDKAKELENFYVNSYKNNNWKILNKNKTGGIGNIQILWSKENCEKEALKYKTKKEFSKNSYQAYDKSLRKGWLNEICTHMIDTSWCYENCKKEALKYENKKDFYTKSNYAYKISCKNKWITDICSHMIENRKPYGSCNKNF